MPARMPRTEILVKSLSTMSPSGFIRAANGQDVCFRSSATLPPGTGGLAIGQLVTSDLDGGKWPAAINVRGPAQHQVTPRAAERHSAGTYLQDMGFAQTGSTRAHRFRRILRGEETREFIVNADLTLFVKHHVGIQEGPALSFAPAVGRPRLLHPGGVAAGAVALRCGYAGSRGPPGRCGSGARSQAKPEYLNTLPSHQVKSTRR
jgi:hypothetical protein